MKVLCCIQSRAGAGILFFHLSEIPKRLFEPELVSCSLLTFIRLQNRSAQPGPTEMQIARVWNAAAPVWSLQLLHAEGDEGRGRLCDLWSKAALSRQKQWRCIKNVFIRQLHFTNEPAEQLCAMTATTKAMMSLIIQNLLHPSPPSQPSLCFLKNSFSCLYSLLLCVEMSADEKQERAHDNFISIWVSITMLP